MAEKIVTAGAQDTGNPVLDSVVNIVAAKGGIALPDLDKLHAALRKLALVEPGGLKRRGAGGALQLAKDGDPAAAGMAAL